MQNLYTTVYNNYFAVEVFYFLITAIAIFICVELNVNFDMPTSTSIMI